MKRKKSPSQPSLSDLFGRSAYQLALAHDVSISTVRRWRARARDPEQARQAAARNAALQRQKRQQKRISATVSAVADISPPRSTHGCSNPRPAIRPNAIFDALHIVAALPQAIRFFRDGGSVSGLMNGSGDDDATQIEAALRGGELETWLIRFPPGAAVRETIDCVRDHQTTVCIALHSGDGMCSGLHAHVVSHVTNRTALRELRRSVNAHPVAQRVRNIVALIDYLDLSTKAHLTTLRWSFGGVEFGADVPLDLRRLISARLLWTRVVNRARNHSRAALSTSMQFIATTAEHVYTYAEKNSYRIPPAWTSSVEALFADTQKFAQQRNEARFAWAFVQSLCGRIRRENWNPYQEEPDDDPVLRCD